VVTACIPRVHRQNSAAGPPIRYRRADPVEPLRGMVARPRQRHGWQHGYNQGVGDPTGLSRRQERVLTAGFAVIMGAVLATVALCVFFYSRFWFLLLLADMAVAAGIGIFMTRPARRSMHEAQVEGREYRPPVSNVGAWPGPT
jgi:hypothetical protein